MEENLKVNKDYIEAFNLGYELAKELRLKSPMFENVKSGNDRMNAMQAGMEQFSKEISKEKNNENTIDLQNGGITSKKNKDSEKGFDLSI